MRLITVVMNEPSTQVRNSETTEMLDYGFNMYSIDKIIDKDTILETKNVELGKNIKVNIVPMEEVTILNNKNKDKRNITYETNIDNIVAPVKKGDKVGIINIKENEKIINTIDLTVQEDIDKANIFIIYYRNLKSIFRGI